MKQVLFSIYGFNFSSYFFFVFLGFIVASIFFLYLAKQQKFNSLHAVDILLIILSTWFIGARLFHIVFVMPAYYLKDPIKMLYVWHGGFVVYGGISITAFFIYIYTKLKKISFYKFLDISAPTLMLGMAIGRIGCFMQGCCYGKPTNLPWGVIIKAVGTEHIHPTQLYMSLYDFLIFLVSLKLLKNNKFEGYTGLIGLALYSIFRFIVEYFRADFRGPIYFFSLSQYISVLVLGLSSTIILSKLIKKYKTY